MPLKTDSGFEIEENLNRAKRELKVSKMVKEYQEDNPEVPEWIVNRLTQLLIREDELDFDIALNQAHREHRENNE